MRISKRKAKGYRKETYSTFGQKLTKSKSSLNPTLTSSRTLQAKDHFPGLRTEVLRRKNRNPGAELSLKPGKRNFPPCFFCPGYPARAFQLRAYHDHPECSLIRPKLSNNGIWAHILREDLHYVRSWEQTQLLKPSTEKIGCFSWSLSRR